MRQCFILCLVLFSIFVNDLVRENKQQVDDIQVLEESYKYSKDRERKQKYSQKTMKESILEAGNLE